MMNTLSRPESMPIYEALELMAGLNTAYFSLQGACRRTVEEIGAECYLLVFVIVNTFVDLLRVVSMMDSFSCAEMQTENCLARYLLFSAAKPGTHF